MLPLGASINPELGRFWSLVLPFPCAVPQCMDQLIWSRGGHRISTIILIMCGIHSSPRYQLYVTSASSPLSPSSIYPLPIFQNSQSYACLYQRPPAHHPTKLAPEHGKVCVRHASNCAWFQSPRFVPVEESLKASERRSGSTYHPNRRRSRSPEPGPSPEKMVPSEPNVKCASADTNSIHHVWQGIAWSR